MDTTKQRITNSSMLLMLFFVLLWQSSNILHLNIGQESTATVDLSFFVLLVVSSVVLLSLFTYISTWTIVTISFQLSFNKPVHSTYQTLRLMVVEYTYKTKRTYQVFQVIRC